MNKLLRLSNGDAQLDLRPEYGGRISRLVFADWDVLRPIPDDEKDVWFGYKGGSFPLVPFSNRIKGAQFPFAGQEISVDPHPREPENALHGHGTFTQWSVDTVTTSTAQISYEHAAKDKGWPWAYRAEQTFSIAPTECRVSLSLTNTSNTPMPAGLGFHPFFPFEGDVKLRFTAQAEWLGIPEAFPTKRVNVRHNFDVPDGASLWNSEDTICYDGFTGDAAIQWVGTNHRLRLSADGLLNHFIVHVPAGAPYFCLEPVSHPTDAFNLAANGVADVGGLVVEPGGSVAASMTLARL